MRRKNLGQITLNIVFRKNTGRIISASEIKTTYFANLPLKNLATGTEVSDSQLDFWIRSEQKQLENALQVLLHRQAYVEKRNFVADNWMNWGWMPTTYMVVTPVSVQGFLNTVMQVNYPQQWLSTKSSSDDESYHRMIELVPISGSGSAISGSSIWVGVFPYNGGFFGGKTVPNYWSLTYITGFFKIPADVMKALALMVSIQLLLYISANVMLPGIASKSIGVDGLSQSVSSTASVNKVAFGALADAYKAQLDETMEILQDNYVGYSWGTMG